GHANGGQVVFVETRALLFAQSKVCQRRAQVGKRTAARAADVARSVQADLALADADEQVLILGGGGFRVHRRAGGDEHAPRLGDVPGGTVGSDNRQLVGGRDRAEQR